MSSLPSSDAPTTAASAPVLRTRRWPYVLAAVAAPFLLLDIAGLIGHLAAGVAMTVAAIAIAARLGEAWGAAGARRAATRTAAIHRGEAL